MLIKQRQRVHKIYIHLLSRKSYKRYEDQYKRLNIDNIMLISRVLLISQISKI